MFSHSHCCTDSSLIPDMADSSGGFSTHMGHSSAPQTQHPEAGPVFPQVSPRRTGQQSQNFMRFDNVSQPSPRHPGSELHGFSPRHGATQPGMPSLSSSRTQSDFSTGTRSHHASHLNRRSGSTHPGSSPDLPSIEELREELSPQFIDTIANTYGFNGPFADLRLSLHACVEVVTCLFKPFGHF